MSPRPLQNLPPGEQDLQLIQRLRARDRAALTEVVRRYQGRLRRQAFKIVNDPALAEDVVQDTWLVVLASVDRFEGRSTLLSWLTGIVINRARDFRRSQSRVRQLSSKEENSELPEVPSGTDAYRSTGRLEPVTELTAERVVLEREQARALDAAVQELPGDATVRRASPAARLRRRGDEGGAADHRSCQARSALAGPLPSPRGPRQVRGLRRRPPMSGEGPDREKPTLRRAVPFATLLFVLVAAHTLLETARDSLFLTRQPISRFRSSSSQ